MLRSIAAAAALAAAVTASGPAHAAPPPYCATVAVEPVFVETVFVTACTVTPRCVATADMNPPFIGQTFCVDWP